MSTHDLDDMNDYETEKSVRSYKAICTAKPSHFVGQMITYDASTTGKSDGKGWFKTASLMHQHSGTAREHSIEFVD